MKHPYGHNEKPEEITQRQREVLDGISAIFFKTDTPFNAENYGTSSIGLYPSIDDYDIRELQKEFHVAFLDSAEHNCNMLVIHKDN